MITTLVPIPELSEDVKARGISLPQPVITWWYGLTSKEKLDLTLKHFDKPCTSRDIEVYNMYLKETDGQ